MSVSCFVKAIASSAQSCTPMRLSSRIFSSVSLMVPGAWRPGGVFSHSMRLAAVIGWVE